MMDELMLLNQVAQLLGVKPYQITYAITSRQVADVDLRMGGRRIFRPGDVRRLAKHFGLSLSTEKGGVCQLTT